MTRAPRRYFLFLNRAPIATAAAAAATSVIVPGSGTWNVGGANALAGAAASASIAPGVARARVANRIGDLLIRYLQ